MERSARADAAAAGRGRLLTPLIAAVALAGCDRSTPEPGPGPAAPAPATSATPSAPGRARATPGATSASTGPAPNLVRFEASAMGTRVTFVAAVPPGQDPTATRKALKAGLAEIRRLEGLMSTWRPDTEVSRINAGAGSAVAVSPETFAVFEKAAWASSVSEGTFDVTFKALDGLWKFGDAASKSPSLPDAATVKARLAHVGHDKVHLDSTARTVRIDADTKVGLGGIAKGYAVDAAAKVLKGRGLRSFLVQAGGDLYGAGRKPGGKPWVSGIQDPRGQRGAYFALLPLEDHAFSTAGDYARYFIVEGKRYHHIIDPRTGYPATACRSVTVWARDALTADAVDDAVFILGPKKGLALVESLPGVGAVVVDGDNRVHVSRRLRGKVKLLRAPGDGP